MGSKWRKLKKAFSFNSCVYVLPAQMDASPPSNETSRVSDAVLPTPSPSSGLLRSSIHSMTPTHSPSVHISRSGSRSSKKTCAICLASMKPGQGYAVFTAECSHSFHFHCITSNVNHGNQVCPVCRMKWKEIPFQSGTNNLPIATRRTRSVNWMQDDPLVRDFRRLTPPWLGGTSFQSSTPIEPTIFDDDEAIDHQLEIGQTSSPLGNSSARKLEVNTYAEVSAVAKSSSFTNFSVVVHIKAIPAMSLSSSQHSRTPVDLVTVLDVSGSMAGSKLSLLKRAMGFVINNLGPSDRLSVVSFSSTARRLFPLRLMTNIGRQHALQAVNSLSSNGGTNIAEGLEKGAKVFVDRTWKNPVGSIILLSDGRDTYTGNNHAGGRLLMDYTSLLPSVIGADNDSGLQIPVHTFGFGPDHDAALLHSISETSRGTFSFIETENVIQDAFAQCIGGLLSVVVQELRVGVECVHETLGIGSIKAGSYQASLSQNRRNGSIYVGDLYAEEERDFLVTLDIPVVGSINEMSLLKVKYDLKDPINREEVSLASVCEVKIERPDVIGKVVVSLEVERQRNRFLAAMAMAEARDAAELGDLATAVSVLEGSRVTLSETQSGQTEDPFCVSLCRELKETQERMASRRVYESTGRAYVLSGLSSHSWQRATSRGSHAENESILYQTPSMVDMVTRSHNLGRTQSTRRSLETVRSFPSQIQPR